MFLAKFCQKPPQRSDINAIVQHTGHSFQFFSNLFLGTVVILDKPLDAQAPNLNQARCDYMNRATVVNLTHPPNLKGMSVLVLLLFLI